MKAIKIIALTKLGNKGLEEMKQQCARYIVRMALKKIKTKVSFNSNEVIIENPAMLYCKDLEHDKSRLGFQQIISSFNELGAKEDIDFKFEVIE